VRHVTRYVEQLWRGGNSPGFTHGFAEHFSWQLATILQSKNNKLLMILHDTP
jgi:hypothetical protein